VLQAILKEAQAFLKGVQAFLRVLELILKLEVDILKVRVIHKEVRVILKQVAATLNLVAVIHKEVEDTHKLEQLIPREDLHFHRVIPCILQATFLLDLQEDFSIQMLEFFFLTDFYKLQACLFKCMRVCQK